MLFNEIYNSGKLTISVLKGKVLGGANGIAAASDIAIATPQTSFAFTEVKLGLIPATIAPYIVRRTGNTVAGEWMLSGRKIDADEAFSRGLVNMIWKEEELGEKLEDLTKLLLTNSPNATAGIKKLFKLQSFSKDPDELIDTTSKLIAGFRVSEEGQEGIRAFFEKRKPRWIHD
jgi:methylglutaconyl-CoA hydratase